MTERDWTKASDEALEAEDLLEKFGMMSGGYGFWTELARRYLARGEEIELLEAEIKRLHKCLSYPR